MSNSIEPSIDIDYFGGIGIDIGIDFPHFQTIDIGIDIEFSSFWKLTLALTLTFLWSMSVEYHFSKICQFSPNLSGRWGTKQRWVVITRSKTDLSIKMTLLVPVNFNKLVKIIDIGIDIDIEAND